MSSQPFDIDLVIARLKARVPVFNDVRGSADYAAITEFTGFRAPEAFVLLARERGKPNPGNSRQSAEAVFGVVIASRNYSQARGKPALDDAKPLIGAVRDSLIGWIPQTDAGVTLKGGRACQWLQGDVMDYDAGVLLWADVFTTQHFIGSTQ